MKIYFQILFCIGQLTIFSQSGEMYFTHFQTEDGLPSREVYCVHQDSLGYLWFGTDNGISRYDGYEFKYYQVINNYEANVVNTIFSHIDTLWFGSLFSGAYYLDDDTLKPYRYNYKLEAYKGKFVTSTLEYISKQGDFYFSLFNYGIIKIDASGKITEYKISENYGYVVINVDGIPIYTRSLLNPNAPLESITHVIFDYKDVNKNRLAIPNNGQYNEKIFPQSKRADGSIFFFFDRLLKVENNKLIKTNIKKRINTLLQSSNDKFYLGFGESNGLGIAANMDDLIAGRYKSYLNNNSVSCIYIDKNNGLWVTTTNNGVYYCKNPDQTIYHQQKALEASYISAVEPMSKDQCYFGTSNGALYFIDKDHYSLTTPYPGKPYFVDEIAYNFYNNRTYAYGGYLKDNRWHVKRSLTKKDIRSFKNFAFDNKLNRVWTSTYKSYGYIDESRTFKNYEGIIKNIFIRIYDIAYANDTLWLATQNGLYANREGTTSCVKMYDQYVNERVNCIAGNDNHIIYVGTKESGLKICKKTGCTSIAANQGLSSNNIRSIFIDDHDAIWVCSNLGLDKITLDQDGHYQIRNFNIAHGLPTNEIYQIKAYGQQYWLATGKGVVKFIEKAINHISPKPIVTSFIVNNNKSIDQKNIKLDYKENNLRIQFTTVNPLLSGKIKYRYRLSNQAQWLYTSARSLEYVEMKSGKYILFLQSANEDNVWSESTKVDFVIETPWWNKWEFYFIVATLLTLMIYGYMINRTRNLTRESNLLIELSKLEKKALQSQMNPHFLANSFTSLQYLINTNNIELADEYLSDLSRLLRKIIDSSRNNEVSLNEELELIKLYIQLEQIRFEHKFQCSYNIDQDLNLDKEMVPPMLIQPIVENAINHAFTSTIQKINLITFDIIQKDQSIHFIITDNGIGLQKSLSLKDQQLARKSYALSIIQDRINNFNQSNPRKIEFFMQDLSTEGKEGTKVTFIFPKHIP